MILAGNAESSRHALELLGDPPDAAVIDRPDIWAVPVLEWASLLSLLAWFVCVSAVLLSEAD